MHTPLRPNEKIVKEGAASFQKNVEIVGGKLFLTDQRLIFEAHKFNVQRGTTEIQLSHVRSTKKCWTRFFLIPMAPNSLAVHTKQGTDYRFVLSGREAWAAAINAGMGDN